MRQVVLLLGIGWLVVVYYAGTWLVLQPPIQLLIPPDATDIHVVDRDWWEWSLTYRTPRSPYGWYFTAVHQLEARGWMESGEQYTGGPLHEPVTYTRMTSCGFFALWEYVELDGDLQGTHVRMRRWIAMQPLKLLSALASNLLFEG